jgi:hypothetical protein
MCAMHVLIFLPVGQTEAPQYMVKRFGSYRQDQLNLTNFIYFPNFRLKLRFLGQNTSLILEIYQFNHTPSGTANTFCKINVSIPL